MQNLQSLSVVFFAHLDIQGDLSLRLNFLSILIESRTVQANQGFLRGNFLLHQLYITVKSCQGFQSQFPAAQALSGHRYRIILVCQCHLFIWSRGRRYIRPIRILSTLQLLNPVLAFFQDSHRFFSYILLLRVRQRFIGLAGRLHCRFIRKRQRVCRRQAVDLLCHGVRRRLIGRLLFKYCHLFHGLL